MGKKLGQQLLMATKKYRELGRASTIVPDGHLLFHYVFCIVFLIDSFWSSAIQYSMNILPSLADIWDNIFVIVFQGCMSYGRQVDIKVTHLAHQSTLLLEYWPSFLHGLEFTECKGMSSFLLMVYLPIFLYPCNLHCCVLLADDALIKTFEDHILLKSIQAIN